MIDATCTEEMPAAGLKVEVKVIPIERGFQATINYAVTVWAVSGGYSSVIPGGEAMLPPGLVESIKLKLWEQIKP